MKKIPNILSASRIPLSLSMMFFAENHAISFIFLFFIAGITDVADGYIARHYDATSEIGAKLDAAADIVFLLSGFTSVFFIAKVRLTKLLISGIAVYAVTKAGNIIFTKLKFKQWNTMHTLMVKYAGLLNFIAVPVCVGMQRIPDALTIALIAMHLTATAEETLILITSKEYNVDRKSIFIKE